MKKIKLENGDFITIDERANKSKKRKKNTKNTEDELSALTEGIIIGAMFVAGVFLFQIMKTYAANEKEIKQIPDKTDPTTV